jgi:hypothetical protein
MNREDIIRMAQKANLVMYDYDHPSLERFAALVAAAEREACAKLIDAFGTTLANGEMLAEAIRARGQA